MRLSLPFVALVALVATWSVGALPARSADDVLFDRDIRPILKTHCSHCHGEESELAGGLDVRLRRSLVNGGDSGAAVRPGDADGSLLMKRINAGEMPPEDVEKRLTSAELATLRRWIAEGAVVESEEPAMLPLGPWISPAERRFWSFQPVQRPTPPRVESTRGRQPVDAFLLATLEANGLDFSDDASKEMWLRRVSLDLTGLPPTPEQLEHFAGDSRPGAHRRVVDRLLNSPAFGERWGRHWLDVAGYSDSEGRVEDPQRADAWRYRDYVISSFNRGRRYDEFIVQQLAGDERVRPPYSELPPEELENLVATGFLRMAADGSASGMNTPEDHNETIADTMQIVGSALLGLTVQCAQCHNHRYDPISQRDYYRLRAIFDPSLNWQQWLTPAQRRVSLYTEEDKRRAAEIEAEAKQLDADRLKRQQEHITRVLAQELAKLPEDIRQPVQAALDTAVKQRTVEQKKLLAKHPSTNVTASSLYLYDRKAADELKAMTDQATKLRATKPVQEYIRALTAPQGQAPESYVFVRGDHQQRGEPVTPGGLAILGGGDVLPGAEAPAAGRRLQYAEWLVSGQHPLLARVMVNRVWRHLFGRGLVDSAGDFGQLGARPSHPELLDYLAAELQDQGWELKPLLRQLVLSTAYRQTSRTLPHEADPENRWYGRMPLRRLDAESVRDSMLLAADTLNREAGGPPVPVMADLVGQFVIGKENLNAGRPGAVLPMHGQEFRRSVYIESRRSRPLAVLDTFDLPAMTPNCSARDSSTVAPQSLLMMNSDVVLDVSRQFAASVRSAAGANSRDQAALAWRRAYATMPDDDQLAAAEQFLGTQREVFAQLTPPKERSGDRDAWIAEEALATFCQALISSNRFLYIE
ncbi:MAG: DUF1549 domain-containing protein [Planctomycetales bacterium]|nr:DUF1549 domain-containing protein [Planctomycetales bacterium]